MQEIKKRRIVLASVLKPVNDPRMYEKMGQSLAHHYEVHIIGTKAVFDTDHTSIFFHPLSTYTRFSIDRILAPAKILRKIFHIKPSLVIVCTHELLWMVLIAKFFLRCKVIYDIRENYFRNILYTNAFPPVLRVFIALYVRTKEWITAPFIDSFFLAEVGYAVELGFIGHKKIVLENKVKKIHLPPAVKWSKEDHGIHLLFSGTLAPTTGVFIAIDLTTKLHEHDPGIKLHIVGFSPMQAVQKQIKNLIGDKTFIHFKESNEPIPHVEILDAVQRADIGIIAYPPNLSTTNTVPTKLFEYLGYKLPILLIDHSPWVELCRPYGAAIPFDFNHLNPSEILGAIKQGSFYKLTPNDVFWEVEEEKLFQAVQRQLK
jgi:glycosyltransferase involved in cell wall biosynthesis